MGDNDSINNRQGDDELFEVNASLKKETNKFEKWQNIERPKRR